MLDPGRGDSPHAPGNQLADCVALACLQQWKRGGSMRLLVCSLASSQCENSSDVSASLPSCSLIFTLSWCRDLALTRTRYEFGRTIHNEAGYDGPIITGWVRRLGRVTKPNPSITGFNHKEYPPMNALTACRSEFPPSDRKSGYAEKPVVRGAMGRDRQSRTCRGQRNSSKYGAKAG